MRQAITPACLIFFCAEAQRDMLESRSSQRKMSSQPSVYPLLLLLTCFLCSGPVLLAQQAKVPGTSAAGSELSPDKAITLAEAGRCRETISALKRAMTRQVAAETRKKAGIVGLRCSLTLDYRDSAVEFIRLLNKQFSRDPDVLFVIVHAYSDLSTRTAQDLGRTAPQSVAAHKLNAEALEMQGKWEPAELEYEGILKKEPNAPGIHFLLGRLLLSRPDAGPDAVQRAKQEFETELQIDPRNAGAEYILGEIARQASEWDEAVTHFSRATKLDTSFGDAYMGLGFSLVALKRYEEAIPPLRVAVRLEQRNPAAHYNLAVALDRSGNKEEAEKEFAIQRQLTQNSTPGEGK
jgi:tetratricopeptide (TPR) repeat protein